MKPNKLDKLFGSFVVFLLCLMSGMVGAELHDRWAAPSSTFAKGSWRILGPSSTEVVAQTAYDGDLISLGTESIGSAANPVVNLHVTNITSGTVSTSVSPNALAITNSTIANATITGSTLTGTTATMTGLVTGTFFKTSTATIGVTGAAGAAPTIAAGNATGNAGQPTTAAQNCWVEGKDSTGATIWLPAWK